MVANTNTTLKVALAGNPNCGKTTIFNAITGENRKVGNYPGVTVEKIEGNINFEGQDINLIDLPGTYSLTAHSLDEVVARNYIIDEKPEVVVNIVDSSNLERNLYLTTQILELNVPVVLVLNMGDVAERKGYKIDVKKLSDLLGVPIVQTVGNKKVGIDELLKVAINTAKNPEQALKKLRKPNYGSEIEPHVQELADDFAKHCPETLRPRWVAVKLLENDAETQKRLRDKVSDSVADEMVHEAEKMRKHVHSVCGDDAEIIIADRRYGYISGACTEAIQNTVEARHDISDSIDKITTNHLLGLPIFALVMLALFQLTFALGNPLVEMLDELIGGQFIPWLKAIWPAADGSNLLRSCLIDGVVAGIGSVIVFIPLIVLMFLGVAFMEDSGYMARAAFVMDKLMHKIGLHGKSFVPMLIGFGCTVPGIMATRTLESKRDRLTTMMVLPLMSCGARMPIYMLIFSAFFPNNKGIYFFAIYAIGILLAIIIARLFRGTIFKGEQTSFVMELPPYRMPTVKGLIHHMWERTWMYAKKAGTVILLASVIIWALSTFPQSKEIETKISQASAKVEVLDAEKEKLDEKVDTKKIAKIDQQISASHEDLHNLQASKLQNTIVGRVGKFIEPAIKPLGFDWKIGTALVGAFSAKEVFVSQIGIVYALGDEVEADNKDLQKKIQKDYSPLVGFCICLFCLISMPCVATFAVTVRESGSWGWGFFQMGYLTVLAWFVTMVVYQVGSLFA